VLRKGRGLVRGTGVVVDGKHHDGYSWAWKNSGCNNNSIITIVIISLTAINSRFVITNSLNVGNGSLKTIGANGARGNKGVRVRIRRIGVLL
jgi:hypothetical protein